MRIASRFDVGGYAEAPEQLFGIECEVESVALMKCKQFPPTILIHEDGSLRNNGREFVTRPLNLETTMKAYKELHEALAFIEPAKAFSSRTSIHVHMNCQNLDEKVVRKIVLFYALFEEAFFAMVDSSRRNNIHCVALTDTALPERYGMSLPNLVASWSKYSAMNLLPLTTQGTVEFRHMQGHNNPALLEEWLTVLDRLFTLARTTELSAKSLTSANILAWFSFLFGQTSIFRDLLPHLDQVVENTVIDVKIGLL